MQVRGEYHVLFHGAREELEGLAAAARTQLESLPDAAGDEYRHFPDRVAGAVEQARNKPGSEPATIRLDLNEDYAGIYGDLLKGMKQKRPGLAVAAVAEYGYDEGRGWGTYYAPSGSAALEMYYDADSQPFPEEAWIPQGWRKPGGAPNARMEGTITPMGVWGEAELDRLRRTLCGDAFWAALGYGPAEPGAVPCREERGTFAFAAGGPLDGEQTLEFLEDSLSAYRTEREEAYAALCRTMRERRLLLHLEMTGCTKPNRFWEYSDESKYHYLISSDGRGLRAYLTWCGTCRWKARGGESGTDVAPYLYQSLTMERMGDLEGSQAYLVRRAIDAFVREHPVPEDFFGRGFDPDIYEMEFEECMDAGDEDAIRELCGPGAWKYLLEHEEELTGRIQEALEQGEELERPVPTRAVPGQFDNRFAGRRFYVDGEDLEGYTREQVRKLVLSFAGQLSDAPGEADYFVCGREVGAPFLEGLHANVTFLTPDYFEDMTR